MSDLISRTELFNRLARVPIGPYAIDERAQIINVINEMEPIKIAFICDRAAQCGGGKSCEDDECFHTTDIGHAANFEKYGGAYMERMRGEDEAQDRPTVIRCKKLLSKEDFEAIAKRIREENQNVIVIPSEAVDISTNISTNTSIDGEMEAGK